MAERVSPFQDLGEHDPMSIADFQPGQSRHRPKGAEIDETSLFPLRAVQPTMPKRPDSQQSADGTQSVNSKHTVGRQPRLFRTGRNSTISIRASAATIERFYEMADRLGVKNAEAFEQAIQVMMERLDTADPP